MRYLIVSDIHANLEALEAVIEAAQGSYDRVICCGDLVGYGADPGAVIAWARENLAAVVRGNHDKACAGSKDIEWFSPMARAAALWTREVLNAQEVKYLIGLRRGPLAVDGFRIMHGAPLDEDEYLVTPDEAARQIPALDCPVGFFGHTHVQGGFRWHRNGNRRIPAVAQWESEYVLELDPEEIFLVNPGSVGQPRDGDRRAAYCVYEPERRIVTYRRTPYDVTAAQRKIRAAGLPDLLADRLEQGR